MSNIWGESPVAFVLAALAAAGLSAIIFGVYYFWVTKTGNKRQLKESEAPVIIAIFFFIGLACSMFLINQLAEDSKRVYHSEQTLNCWNSKTSDGKDLTENQCEYFQDVLDGKYVKE